MENGSLNVSHSLVNRTTSVWANDGRMLGWFIMTLITNGFGVLANILLLLALIVYKPLRISSSCALIIHCIAINLYTTAIVVPLTSVASYLGPQYRLPPNYCESQAMLIMIAYPAASYAEMVLAVNRLCAAIMPKLFGIMTRKVTIFAMLILPWVAAVTVNIFPTLEIGLKWARAPTVGGCTLFATNSSNQYPISLYTAATTYSPTAIMGVCYIIILLKTAFDLRRRRQSLALQRRLEISRTLFLSFLWYCITQYPMLIIVSFHLKTYAASPSLQLGIRYLTNSFFATNPIFYFISSHLFQEGAKKVLIAIWTCRGANRKVDPMATSVNRLPAGESGSLTTHKKQELNFSQSNRSRPSNSLTGGY